MILCGLSFGAERSIKSRVKLSLQRDVNCSLHIDWFFIHLLRRINIYTAFQG